MNAYEKDQHDHGLSWLAEKVQDGQLASLLATHPESEHRPDYVDAVATLSGNLRPEQVPKKQPEAAGSGMRPAESLLTVQNQSFVEFNR